MAHDADQYADTVVQWDTPAETAAAEAAHVSAQAAKYASARDAAVAQYQERTA